VSTALDDLASLDPRTRLDDLATSSPNDASAKSFKQRADAAIKDIEDNGAVGGVGSDDTGGSSIGGSAHRAPQGLARSNSLHSLTAWLNVNRGMDYNVMHTHPSRRWSGVYYVSQGDAPTASAATAGAATAGAATASQPTDEGVPTTVKATGKSASWEGEGTRGHLVFRAGPVQRSAEAAAPQASHSYFSVPPVPGTLLLFPGGLPHTVMGRRQSLRPAGGDDGATLDAKWLRATARISIAINATHAGPPMPISVSCV